MIRIIVILCYVILGASLGVYLIPEIAVDTGLSDYMLLTNNYFNGLLGIVIFFLIFGWFIKKATLSLKELEQTIMRQSAVEILFATIGLMIGLVISVMISFIFQIIGNNVLNHFVPIIVTIILGYFGFQFGLRKRDEMLLFFPENMARSMSINARNAVPKLLIQVLL